MNIFVQAILDISSMWSGFLIFSRENSQCLRQSPAAPSYQEAGGDNRAESVKHDKGPRYFVKFYAELQNLDPRPPTR